MRLLISQRPHRRHRRLTRDTRVFLHDRRRIARTDDEYIKRQRFGRRLKLSFASREIKRAQGSMNEDGPAIRTDHPLNWNTSAMRRQLVTALAAAVREGLSFTIKLRT